MVATWPVYLVTYSRFAKRQQMMRDTILHNISFTLVDEHVNRTNKTQWASRHERQPSASNFFSHTFIWGTVASAEGKGGLIFEDDVVSSDFVMHELRDLLDSISTTESFCLFFGSCASLVPTRRDVCYENACIRSKPTHVGTIYPMTRCTHAYAISKTCAREMVSYLHRPYHKAIDRWMNAALAQSTCKSLWSLRNFANQSRQDRK